MNPRSALTAAPVLFATLFAASFAHADVVPDPGYACHEAGGPCRIEGNKGLCRSEYSEFQKRDVLVCDLNAKPSDPTPVTPSSTTPSSTPNAKEDASKTSPRSSSSGCGVSKGVDIGFGLGAIVGGVAVALLAVRRRRAR